jgi:hypothetical protein
MFGPRLTRVFASRWAALWWAATILLLAWQLVPSPDDDAPQSADSAADSNPWALSTPAGEGR